MKRWKPLLALLMCLLLAACTRTTLYADLDERQANEVLAALLSTGIGAEKRISASKTGWEIRVDQSDFPQAMQVLHARGLPGQRYQALGDIFRKDGFSTSAQTERSMLQHGLQQELSRTLSRYPGVAEAHVHINLPERDPLGGTATGLDLQRLRDEAHRFAISAHRAKRSKAIGQSLLDEVTGIGAGGARRRGRARLTRS